MVEEHNDNLIKVREIAFCTLHPNGDQAGSAAALLVDLEGIHHVDVKQPSLLSVTYHLLVLRLADIETMLEEKGFHLDNRMIHKIRRALFHYTEETQRANLGCSKGESNCTQKVFVNRYQNRDHGCQDERPDHWRRYL